MGKIEKFEDLEVWQRGRLICQYVEELFQKSNVSKKL